MRNGDKEVLSGKRTEVADERYMALELRVRAESNQPYSTDKCSA